MTCQSKQALLHSGPRFLSDAAVLGKLLQMGLISDRPHTPLRPGGGYFYEDSSKRGHAPSTVRARPSPRPGHAPSRPPPAVTPTKTAVGRREAKEGVMRVMS